MANDSNDGLGGRAADNLTEMASPANIDRSPARMTVTVPLPIGTAMSVWRAALDRLSSDWLAADHPGLARWVGSDEAAHCVVWELPDQGLRPIAAVGVPRSSREVRSVLEQLAGPLEALHAARLGAFDLSPQRVYVDPSLSRCVIVPSPWLAAAEISASAARGPFIAPEVGDGTAEVEPIRADVYALGALTWYLLTGDPPPNGITLLSEVRPALSAWDELIDGCCRSRVARRFATIRSVIAALPPVPGTPTDPPAAGTRVDLVAPALTKSIDETLARTRTPDPVVPTPPSRPFSIRLALLGTAALALVVMVGYLAFSGGGLVRADYERGFAGTVVRYADGGYEGTSWKKLYAAANLGNLPVVGQRTVELQRITGVDEQNLWIADKKGVVFRLTDGHWQIVANRPDASDPLVWLIDDQTLLMGGGYYAQDHIYLVEPGGVRSVAYEGRLQPLRANQTVTPIASGLSYVHTYRETYKLLEGRLTLSTPGTKKDSLVVDTDGAPVNIANSPMTPNLFRYSATFSPGETYAVWMHKAFGARLVKYRDGAWVMLEEIGLARSAIDTFTAAWISRDDEGGVFIVFGGVGAAVLYQQGRGVMHYPINTATAASRMKLIAVWGAGPKRFWVMDESGSVWERSDDHWRQVIGGLFDEKINFKDAWVSPNGVVFAVSNDALYRLN
jgi:hypothetical protein